MAKLKSSKRSVTILQLTCNSVSNKAWGLTDRVDIRIFDKVSYNTYGMIRVNNGSSQQFIVNLIDILVAERIADIIEQYD